MDWGSPSPGRPDSQEPASLRVGSGECQQVLSSAACGPVQPPSQIARTSAPQVRVPHSPACPCPCPYRTTPGFAHFQHCPEQMVTMACLSFWHVPRPGLQLVHISCSLGSWTPLLRYVRWQSCLQGLGPQRTLLPGSQDKQAGPSRTHLTWVFPVAWLHWLSQTVFQVAWKGTTSGVTRLPHGKEVVGMPHAHNCSSLSCISPPTRCLQVHSLAQCEPWQTAVAWRSPDRHLRHFLPEAAQPSCTLCTLQPRRTRSPMLSPAIWSSLAFRARPVPSALPHWKLQGPHVACLQRLQDTSVEQRWPLNIQT